MCSSDSSTDLSSTKNFEIVCLHVWWRSWLDKMRTVELNPWTLGRSTSPKERAKMSMQFNSAACMIDPTRSTSKSPTTSENLSTVGLPTCHHRRHANRLHATRNLGAMTRNRVLGRRSVSFTTDVVERAILPDSAHQRMIAKTWMKSEQSDLFGLDWVDDPITTTNSVTERNDKIRGGKELLAFGDSGVVDNVLPKSGVYRVSSGGRLPSRRAELVFKAQTCHTSGTTGSDAFELRQALEEGSQACSGRSRGSSARIETQFRLRGPVVCSPYGCGFRRVFRQG